MTIKRVTLDYGHGGDKPGASYAGVLEKDLNLQLGNKIYSALHELSEEQETLKVILTRDSDEDIPLGIRYQLINQYHKVHTIDLVASIHFNAAPSVPQAHGFEVYYLDGSVKGTAAATSIVQHVRQQDFYIRGRGYKTTAELGRQLAMIHKTTPPAVLIETAFLSNENDRLNAVNINWQNQMAQAIAQGIWAYLRSVNG
ncbi:N-acetylmuramoyl-L-alanine amidase AmiC [Thalassocella blandensis]|nr:N-acetylmuramoyl-L-alanine amidase AmiC [Thalassocella blandensis]